MQRLKVLRLTENSLPRLIEIINLQKFGVEEGRPLVPQAERQEVVGPPQVAPKLYVDPRGAAGAHRQFQEHDGILRRDEGLQHIRLRCKIVITSKLTIETVLKVTRNGRDGSKLTIETVSS